MTVYAVLLTAPQGEYDMSPEVSKILYDDVSEQDMVFMAIDEREYPEVTNEVRRDSVVSSIWRSYMQVVSAADLESRARWTGTGVVVQIVPHQKLFPLITRQGVFADAE